MRFRYGKIGRKTETEGREREGEGGKKKLTLVRIDLPLYPRLIQDARITRVYPLIELSREKKYSLVNEARLRFKAVCTRVCISRVVRRHVNCVTEGDFSSSSGYKRRPY